MGRAEDLLNGLQNTDTNNEISLLIAGENTDTEPHFVINDNRVISVPSELKTIAVQYDHNIETVTFDCPRYWDGHDMSKMVIYINYERADGETGAYLADNVRVDDEDDSIMHFEWTISRNVTSVSGSVTFLVCVKSVDKSGDEQEHWNSERCSDISVAPGLETGEPIEEKYPDVLTQLSDKYDTLNKAAARINDATIGTDSTYSSQKIENLVETVLPSGGEDGNVLMKKSQGEIWGKVIDDTQPSSTTTTLSASGITQALDTLEQTINGSLDTLEAKVDGKPNINDSVSSTTSVYSSDKVDNLLNEISTGSGSVPPGGTAGQVLRKSDDNSIIEWSTIIDDSKSATGTTYSSSKIDGLVGAVDTKVNSKANQSDLTALQGTVSTLQTTVGTKADTATVTELSSKVDSLEETVETKAGINDSQTTANNTWSAQKIQNQINLGAYDVYYLYTDDVKTVSGLDFTVEITSPTTTFKDGDIVIVLPGYDNEPNKARLLEIGGWIFKSAEVGTKTVTLTAFKKAPSVGNWLSTRILIIRSKGA